MNILQSWAKDKSEQKGD